MRTELTSDSLVDEIYEAAVIPELWRNVLEQMAVGTEGAFGSLFTFDSYGGVRWIGTPEADALISDFAALGKPELNTRVSRGRDLLKRGFATDYDIFTPDELNTEPFYRDFLYPRGYGWVAGTSFEIPSGDTLIFSLERSHQRGNFEPHLVDQLNRLRPHIGRAGLMSARLGLQRARAAAQALDAIGLPGAVLRARGQVYALNSRFASLMPSVAQDRRERLTLTDPSADKILEAALAGLANPGISGPVQSIAVAARPQQPPMVLHILPVRRAALDIFDEATSILVVTPVDQIAVPEARLLEGLFDLSPAEARVARGIAEARSVDVIANDLNVSRETVRTHLQMVLRKTGLNRQTQLARLLAGAAIRH